MVKEDADACILWVKCMLDGQYVEILPPKKYHIGLHWNANACMGRPKQARKFPGSASRLASRPVMHDCLCCWQHARRKRGKASQPGLRSSAPSFGLANQRARGVLSPPHKNCIKGREERRCDGLV